ncbi:MAG TPA: tetratricopeptide repeat protein [Melioribacteraceae bacterium]|mgnify:CR=1 FL=1|nr:tetratricopeptide repeat protein [Melioribacteraceae bacterium]
MNIILRFFKKGEIEKLLKEGSRLIEEKEYEKALPLFEKVLTYDDKNLCAIYGMAKSNYYINNYEMAKNIFTDLVNNPLNTFFESYYYLYKIEIENQELSSAVKYLTLYIEKGKDKVAAYKLRAELNFKFNKYLDVIDDCEKVLISSPDDMDAFKLMIKSRIKTDQLKKALIDVNKALDNYGNSPDLLNIRSYLRYLNRNYSDALNDIKSAISLNNFYPDSYYTFALIQIKVNQQTDALNNLNKAIELNPNFADAYIVRAELFTQLDKPDEALADYKKVLEYFPDNSDYHFKSGKLNMLLFDFTAAKINFEKALILDSGNHIYLFYLACTYKELKRYKEQQDYLNRALEIKPDYEDALLELGILFYKAKLFKDAIKILDKLISINSENRRAYFYRAKVKEQLADNYGANSDYTIALLDPNYYDAWVSRGLLKVTRSDFHGAVLDFNKAIALRPNNGIIYIYRAKAFVKLEKHGEAYDDFTKALEILPSNVECYYFRGFINYDMRRFKNAISDWEKAVSLKPDLASKLNDNINKAKIKVGN